MGGQSRKSSTEPWDAETPGLLTLPCGATVRGRRLRREAVGQLPTLGIYLSRAAPAPPSGPHFWIRWPDFWVPSDPDLAERVLRAGLAAAGSGRVEIACPGGVGRTGTGLAALCVLDGLTAERAVSWVRGRYHPRAVEVAWQRRFLRLLEARQG